MYPSSCTSRPERVRLSVFETGPHQERVTSPAPNRNVSGARVRGGKGPWSSLSPCRTRVSFGRYVETRSMSRHSTPTPGPLERTSTHTYNPRPYSQDPGPYPPSTVPSPFPRRALHGDTPPVVGDGVRSHVHTHRDPGYRPRDLEVWEDETVGSGGETQVRVLSLLCLVHVYDGVRSHPSDRRTTEPWLVPEVLGPLRPTPTPPRVSSTPWVRET